MDIRPYRPPDLGALYDICLKTGEAGQDATGLYDDPKLLGHLYAAPYGVLSPEASFVAEDEQGVCGYIIGAVDTRAFNERMEARWWPDLRAALVEPSMEARETWSRDETLRYAIHHPQRMARRVLEHYPSHLHIDLLPRAQGQGLGRRLVDHWLAAIWRLGSPGAHLGVAPANQRGKRFYEAYGWQRLDLGLPPEAVVFGLKRPG